MDSLSAASMFTSSLSLGPSLGTSRKRGSPFFRLIIRASAEAEAPTEPKWKQKLAAAEAHAQQTREATAQRQEEYRRRLDAERQSGDGHDSPPLESLPLVPYLTEEGKIADFSEPTARASVYAIYDEHKQLQYVGVTRQVYQSMRIHFARRPQLCFFARVLHLSRPSRAVLDSIRDLWVREAGGAVPGNDGAQEQSLWENAVDCKLVMTEEEKRSIEEAAPGPPKARALKQLARRVEAEIVEIFAARNCTEELRFDPKIKETGRLDLKSQVPDTSVPKSAP